MVRLVGLQFCLMLILLESNLNGMAFKGPCYLALSLFCSTQSFVSVAVYSTAQSLSVKRKPELDIAEKSELGRARICRCKTHNYHEIFLV